MVDPDPAKSGSADRWLLIHAQIGSRVSVVCGVYVLPVDRVAIGVAGVALAAYIPLLMCPAPRQRPIVHRRHRGPALRAYHF